VSSFNCFEFNLIIIIFILFFCRKRELK
jgi:hypothetical protein